MKRRLSFLVSLSLLAVVLSCSQQPTGPEPSDILARLEALPGIEITEVAPLYGYNRAFQIDMLQPVNHEDLKGLTYTQRIYLMHADESQPMVFSPSGYGTTLKSVSELAEILQANHLAVEHRYFEDARPVPTDWRYLTVRQSAADHHRIVNLFKRVYTGPWISTGVSKGGETVFFHRRFYPDDVDATVAYVAPLVLGAPDFQFLDFFDSVGTETCRNRIHEFQRRMLAGRDSLLSMFEQWFPDNGYTFSREPAPVFESRVVSYQWSFWQYHDHDCESIPGPEATGDEIIDHFAAVVKLHRSADEGLAYYQPYYYQAARELGYPATPDAHLQDLLQYRYNLAPADPSAYDPTVVYDTLSWLQTEGNNIIYIYGSIDPWTARAVESIGMTNALWILQEGGDHRIKIADLDERQVVLDTLEEWLGVSTLPSSRNIMIPRRAQLPPQWVPPILQRY